MQISTLEHDGFTICTHQTGSGEPIIFLHGFPDSSHVWHGLMEPLGENFHCIGIDIPGLGNTRPPANCSFKLKDQGNFVKTALDALEIRQPIHLVVHDLGTFPGLAYATDNPEQIRSITIFNADFHSDFRWYFWAKVWRLPILGEIAMHTSNLMIFKSEMRHGSPGFTDAYLKEVYDRITTYNRTMALKYFRAWNKEELTVYEPAFLENTRDIPKLVIWGIQDPYSAVTYAARFGTDNIAYREDCGHWMMIEATDFSLQHMQKFLGE